MTKPGVLVTAVGAPPGLNAARALLETERYRVFVADSDIQAPGLYQYGNDCAVLPSAQEKSALLEALERLQKRWDIQVLLPCIEEEILVLVEETKVLEAMGLRTILPDPKVVAMATDKASITAEVQRLGFAAPASQLLLKCSDQTTRIKQANELMDVLRPGSTWILKPVLGHGMRGVQYLSSSTAVQEAASRIGEDSLLQECIPGKIGSMHLSGLMYDGAGTCVRSFESRSVLTLHAEGGPATGGVSLFAPELAANTKRIVESLGGWKGPLNAEWMLDPRDGTFKFVEINPRLWGYGYLATAAGLNFPDLTVRLAMGEQIGPDPGYSAGVTLLRSSYDVVLQECPFDPPPV